MNTYTIYNKLYGYMKNIIRATYILQKGVPWCLSTGFRGHGPQSLGTPALTNDILTVGGNFIMCFLFCFLIVVSFMSDVF